MGKMKSTEKKELNKVRGRYKQRNKKMFMSLTLVTLPLLGTYITELPLVGNHEWIVYAEERTQQLIVSDKGIGSQYEKYLDPDTDNYITLDVSYNRYTKDANHPFIIELEKSTGILYVAKLAVDTGVVTDRIAIPQDGRKITVDSACFSISDNGKTFSFASDEGFSDPFIELYQNNRTFVNGVVNFGSIPGAFGILQSRYIPQEKSIEVRYQDEKGNTLHPTLIKTGFDTVETYSLGEPIEISGYKLIQNPTVAEVPISQNDTQNIVTYIYGVNVELHQLIVDKVQKGDTVITGKGVAGDKITLSDQSGNIIGEGVVEQDGTFSISLVNAVQEGETIIATPESDGQKWIETVIVAEKNVLMEQQKAGKEAIDNAANNTKTAIEQDQTLTAKEKADQKEAVDAEAAKAKEAIDRGTTADEIESARTSGVADVTNQYQPGTSQTEQQTAGKEAIDNAANKTKTAIDQDQTLTAKEKADQKEAVDAEAAKTKEAIDRGTTADEIESARTSRLANVTNQYQPGTSLTEQPIAKSESKITKGTSPSTGVDETNGLKFFGMILVIISFPLVLSKKIKLLYRKER